MWSLLHTAPQRRLYKSVASSHFGSTTLLLDSPLEICLIVVWTFQNGGQTATTISVSCVISANSRLPLSNYRLASISNGYRSRHTFAHLAFYQTSASHAHFRIKSGKVLVCPLHSLAPPNLHPFVFLLSPLRPCKLLSLNIPLNAKPTFVSFS